MVSEGGNGGRGQGAGLTRASLSSVVSDSACKDLRNFGVTGGKHKHIGTSRRLMDPQISQARKTLLAFFFFFYIYAN